jgi:hypothetical protein
MNHIALTSALLAAANLLLAAPPTAKYEFRAFAVCQGCPTATGGISDQRLIGAAQTAPLFPVQGYIYDANTNTATAVPGTVVITVPSDNGTAPGLGFGPGGPVPLIVDQRQNVTALAGYPGAAFTSVLQFNRNSASVGYASSDFASWFSFYRSSGGAYTKLVYPGPVGSLTLGTFLLGWNEAGTMVGYLADPTETQFAGVIRDKNGEWQTWNVPGATSTIIYAITESGILAGGYQDASGWHGFVWSFGRLETIDFPGASNTVVSGINNRGDLVGTTFNGVSPLQSVPGAFVALRVGSR